MTTTTPDPINNNQERVLVRNTVTGFEQGIAAVAGLFTAGPLGAVASWATIRGVQGKWTPWFILGVPGAVTINIVNVVALGLITGAASDTESSYVPPATNESAPVTSTYEAPSRSLPSYNVSNIGGTTLVTKCNELVQAQNTNDLGKVLNLGFDIGYEHGKPNAQSACKSVGVNTVY